jgi:hypothetical protein
MRRCKVSYGVGIIGSFTPVGVLWTHIRMLLHVEKRRVINILVFVFYCCVHGSELLHLELLECPLSGSLATLLKIVATCRRVERLFTAVLFGFLDGQVLELHGARQLSLAQTEVALLLSLINLLLDGKRF